MPNSRYQKGAAFERRVKADLEAKGYFVVRSAGSKSPVDLVAILPSGEAAFYQCKIRGAITKANRYAFTCLAVKYNSTSWVARNERGKIVYE